MRYLGQVLILAVALLIGSFVIPAVAQQPVVQWQSVVNTINNIQSQLASLSAQINALTIPSGPNQVLAGPTSGTQKKVASFRLLVPADIPALVGDANGSYAGNTVTNLHFGNVSVPLSGTPTLNYFLQYQSGGLVFAVPTGTVPTNPTGSGQLLGNLAGVSTWTAAGGLGQLLIGQASGLPLWTSITGDLTMNSLGQTTVTTLQGVTPGGNCTNATAPFVTGLNGTATPTCMTSSVTPQMGALALSKYLVSNLPSCSPTTPLYEAWVADANAACVTGNAPTGGGSTLCKVICNGPSGAGWLEELVSGTGTVTSVGLTMDGTIFNTTVTNSPVTGAATLTPSLLTQTAHTALMGPTSGSPASPTFRVLAASDIPNPGGDVTNTYAATQVVALHFGATQQTLSGTAPTTGQCLQYNGTSIVGGTCGSGGGGGTNDTPICNLSGTTAGTVTCYEPWRAVSDKEVSCIFTGYENTTSTPQTCTYGTAFTNANSFAFEPNSNPPSASSATTLSLPINQVTPFTGILWIKGL